MSYFQAVQVFVRTPFAMSALQLVPFLIMCNIHTMFVYPTSQGELIRTARGARTQVEFAKLLGCDRSCLSRYEREQLGASPKVINQCLRIVANSMARADVNPKPYERALLQARRVVAELEMLEKK